MTKLTLAICMYKSNVDEIDYWNNLFINIKDVVDFWILYDGNIEEVELKTDINIFNNKNNSGKAKLVDNFIKNNYDEVNEFIKLCDPDDRIDESELRKLLLQIEGLSNTNICINRRLVINSKTKIKFEKTLTNDNTILNRDALYKNEIEIPSISKSSDTLLAFVATTYVPNVTRVNNSFYIYNYRNGISGNSSINDKQKYFDELKILLNFYKENESLNNIREYNCTPWHFTFVWSVRVIKSFEHLSEIEKKKEIVDITEKINDVSRQNRTRRRNQKWLYWKKIYINKLKKDIRKWKD